MLRRTLVMLRGMNRHEMAYASEKFKRLGNLSAEILCCNAISLSLG